MPKKSATARGGAQRHKTRAQKSFELVRPGVTTEEREELELEQEQELKPEPEYKSTKTARTRATKETATATEERRAEEGPGSPPAAAPQGSAGARLAARRQTQQRNHQRNASALITTEHFAYVQKDLITITVLSVLMFAIIIGAYFIYGT